MSIESAISQELEITDIADLFLIGYALPTREAYHRDLADWFNFCQAAGIHPQNATRPLCDAFSRLLSEQRGLSASTVARRLSALSSFYKFMVDEGYVTDNPVSSTRRPKVGADSSSTGLTEEQVTNLILAAKAHGPRAYALVMLLAHNGLRISEALNANMNDLGSERGYHTLKIVRKGGKVATIPLREDVYAAIIAQAAFAVGTVHPIFSTRTGGRFHRADAWKLVRLLGGGSGCHPHLLRHAFVTISLDNGAALHHVQDAVGHANPSTTQRYNRARDNFDKNPTHLLNFTPK